MCVCVAMVMGFSLVPRAEEFIPDWKIKMVAFIRHNLWAWPRPVRVTSSSGRCGAGSIVLVPKGFKEGEEKNLGNLTPDLVCDWDWHS